MLDGTTVVCRPRITSLGSWRARFAPAVATHTFVTVDVNVLGKICQYWMLAAAYKTHKVAGVTVAKKYDEQSTLPILVGYAEALTAKLI
jgi:hypothetical protein